MQKIYPIKQLGLMDWAAVGGSGAWGLPSRRPTCESQLAGHPKVAGGKKVIWWRWKGRLNHQGGGQGAGSIGFHRIELRLRSTPHRR